MRHGLLALLVVCGLLSGCGTTKWTDTRRSATEQLLISDAMDRAVSELDFRALAGKTIYLDDGPLKTVTDSEYLISSLRQHMLASGCVLKDKSEADYIVEARAGAVGTDRHELFYGIPSVNIPTVIPVAGYGIPPRIPEVPFITRDDQRAVAKIAVFAYHRDTGLPLWQSGIVPAESNAKAVWVFGAGPFQRGSIYQGTEFAGEELNIPLIDLGGRGQGRAESISVADEAYFVQSREQLAGRPGEPLPNAAPDQARAEQGPKSLGLPSRMLRTTHAPALALPPTVDNLAWPRRAAERQ